MWQNAVAHMNYECTDGITQSLLSNAIISSFPSSDLDFVDYVPVILEQRYTVTFTGCSVALRTKPSGSMA